MRQSFSISPRILSHLGEDLIKNESIALLELVKNSYDACAQSCLIDFHFTNGSLDKIIIRDDGFGMDVDVIKNVWLVIGTDFKLGRIRLNECGRIPLGEKGIGRLGIHKLGNKICLTSKALGKKEVRMKMDWNSLADSKNIADFPIELAESETPKIFKNSTGTEIEISDLKSSWDRRKLREVYRNLNSLNSPFTGKNESFHVYVKSNSFVFEGLPDFRDIENSALYFGQCTMKGNKIIDFTYEFRPWNTLDKIDSGRKKSLSDLIPQERILIDEDGNEIDLEKNGVGPVKLDILIFELSSQIFNFVNTEKKSIKDYLRDNGGIRVYRDGVRVYNYGEKDNDWLGLEQKRLSRFAGNISNNMIIGGANLSRAESIKLKEKSNREGFIENDAYFSFWNAVDYALSIIVRERSIDKEILNSLYKKHRAIEPVIADLNELIGFVGESVNDRIVKDEILKYLYRINDQYGEVKETLLKSANAGLNLSIVVHEVEKLIHSLSGSIERQDREGSIKLSQRLEKIVKGYSAMIKKSEILNTKLSVPIQQALDNFDFRFLDHNISIISNHKNSSLSAFLAESQTISVLTNLLDNSIYWLKYANRKERYISIFVTDEVIVDDKIYHSIIISDNGPGFNIPTEIATRPFITGKPHNIGSGLGLHVASEMMNAMNGHLVFLEKHEILLPNAAKNSRADKAIIALCFPVKK